ncbi:MAG: PqqD family protein [Acidimicrobiales bacterium]
MGTQNQEQYFTIPASVVSRTVGDELVLVDLDSERYFSLNATGATIWEELAAGRSAVQALNQLTAKFDVTEEIARADLDELVEALVSSGLLFPGEPYTAEGADQASP